MRLRKRKLAPLAPPETKLQVLEREFSEDKIELEEYEAQVEHLLANPEPDPPVRSQRMDHFALMESMYEQQERRCRDRWFANLPREKGGVVIVGAPEVPPMTMYY